MRAAALSLLRKSFEAAADDKKMKNKEKEGREKERERERESEGDPSREGMARSGGGFICNEERTDDRKAGREVRFLHRVLLLLPAASVPLQLQLWTGRGGSRGSKKWVTNLQPGNQQPHWECGDRLGSRNKAAVRKKSHPMTSQFMVKINQEPWLVVLRSAEVEQHRPRGWLQQGRSG